MTEWSPEHYATWYRDVTRLLDVPVHHLESAEALVRQMGDMLLRIRSYADTAIGGEGYLVPPGGFYAIDAVLNDPLAIRLMEER